MWTASSPHLSGIITLEVGYATLRRRKKGKAMSQQNVSGSGTYQQAAGSEAMSQEKVLVLSTFDTEVQADEAAAALKQWDKATEDIRVGGIGILVKDQSGKIKEHKVGAHQTGKGAGVGLVLGLVAAIPTGGLSLAAGSIGGVIIGAIVGSFFQKGFKELSRADAERINKELDAGHAIVGVLVLLPYADATAAELTRLGGRTETHVINSDEMKQVDTVAASASAAQQPSAGMGQTTTPQA
jgi:hypothetical protein